MLVSGGLVPAQWSMRDQEIFFMIEYECGGQVTKYLWLNFRFLKPDAGQESNY